MAMFEHLGTSPRRALAAQHSGSRGRPGAQLPLQPRRELAEAARFPGCRPGDSPGPAASLISIRERREMNAALGAETRGLDGA